MELRGTWKAVEADEALRRTYPEPDFDDAGWDDLAVPSHWRSAPSFAGSDGPLLARHRFDGPAPGDEHDRWWLTFDGVFYQSDVWLDGTYLGDTEGYFFPHTFEVTEHVRGRREHVLAVEVTCAPQRDRTAKRNLTGVFQHWDCIDPDWNPGGIWRPVRIDRSGPVRIRRLRVLCPDAAPERAVLALRAVVDAAEPGTVALRTRVGDTTEVVEPQTLARGENRVDWTVTVESPALWWPHGLGEPHLTDVHVDVTPEDADEPSDARAVRTGIRQVRMKSWIASINGERLFLKGTNSGPTRMALAEATSEQLERDVLLAKEAGLDLLRVHGHVSRPELYDAADAHGMLVWQDLPLQWGYARGVRKQAMRQAREAVDLLGHHPSVAIWCAHNEPLALDVEPGGEVDQAKVTRTIVAGLALPTWNKTVLDASVRRALEKADRSRPVVAHSGVPPRTDSHLYFGWYHGRERDLPKAAAAWPRLVRFVSEFGAQAVPESAGFMDPERWPHLDWNRLARTHALQRPFFHQNGLDPADFPTFEAWKEATQQHQAEVIRFHVETLRRLKYRPTGGFAHFSLADAHPGVTWSVLDHERRPKQGYEALRAVCAPVIVVADRPEREYRTGDPIALDVHVVSDLREPIEGATVGGELTWRGGEHRWAWRGDVPADACVRVGTIQAVAGEASGPLRLSLQFVGGGRTSRASYESRIVPR